MTFRAGSSTVGVREFRAPRKARASIQQVERLVERSRSVREDVTVVHRGDSATLDGVLLDALLTLAHALDSGEPVTVLVGGDQDRELTSQETADLLNVSRPYVVKLATTGELPHRKVGNRHRFQLSDVLAYDQLASRRRSEALAALSPEEGYTVEDF